MGFIGTWFVSSAAWAVVLGVIILNWPNLHGDRVKDAKRAPNWGWFIWRVLNPITLPFWIIALGSAYYMGPLWALFCIGSAWAGVEILDNLNANQRSK